MNWSSHQVLEKSSILLLIGILITVAIGGIVEIAPLYWLSSTIEKVQGMRPYTPLELAGRDIYIREGCYVCHSQMVRSLRDEVERYGHYSLAAESMYDHPFQWGSKRTGPDLARVGGKYSDEWHAVHMTDPRAIVPELIMPGYPRPRPNRARLSRHRRSLAHEPRRRRALYRRDDRERQGRSRAAARPGGGRREGVPRALPQGADAAPSTAIRPRCRSSMPSSPICKCSARWSTSPSSTRPGRI